MKKIYLKPAMEVVAMEGNDVIATSSLSGGDQSRPTENGYGEAPNRRNAIWDED